MSIFNDEDFKRLKSGDSRAFEKLYHLHKDKLYNYILIKCGGDRDFSDEVMSETIMSALNSVKKIKKNNNLSGWLITIAFRRFNDLLRKRYREDNFIEKQKLDTEEESQPVENDLLEKEKFFLLNHCLSQIKEKYQEILKLKYYENMSQKEMAGKLGKSEKSIEGLLHRARIALKKELGATSYIFEEGQ